MEIIIKVKQNNEKIKEFDIERIYTSIKEETNLTNDEARNITFIVQNNLNYLTGITSSNILRSSLDNLLMRSTYLSRLN